MAEGNGFRWQSVLDAYNLVQEIFPPLEFIEINAEETNNITHATNTTVNNIVNKVDGIAFIRDFLTGNFNYPFNLSFNAPLLPAWGDETYAGFPSFERLKPYLDSIVVDRFVPGMAQLGFPQVITGAGNMAWAQPMGAVIELTNIPNTIGRAAGNPQKLFDAGLVGWGQMGGWHGFERLEFERTALIPAPPGCTGLRWVLPEGLEATVYMVLPKPGVG